MEPISAVASIITLISAARVASRSLQSLRSLNNVPSEIVLLSNEVADFQLVIDIVAAMIQQQSPESKGQVDDASQALLTLFARAETLLSQLNRLVNGKFLVSSSASRPVSKTARLTWLFKYRDMARETQRELRTLKTSIVLIMSALQSQDIAKVHSKLEQLGTGQLPLSSLEDEKMDRMQEIFFDAPSALNDTSSDQCSLIFVQCGAKAEAYEDSNLSICTSPPSQNIRLLQNDKGGRRRRQVNRRFFRSPDSFGSIVGRLAISWTTVSSHVQQNDSVRYRQGSRYFHLTYFMPNWFSMRRISAYFRYAMGVPEFSHAIRGRHLELCKFLAREGADMCSENFFSRRPVDDVWDLVTSTTDSTREAWKTAFIDDDFPEEKQFSILHKSVTNMTASSVSQVLEHSGLDVDVQDSDGHTALSLAAGTTNLLAVTALIDAGADPNIRNRLQIPAIFFSAQSASVEVTRALLACGADVNAKDHWGNTALHCAASSRPETSVTSLLLASGAEVDVEDRSGFTPLCAAVWWHNEPVARFLLEHGANLEQRTKDSHHYTPLLQAVRQNAHTCLRLLLDWGANLLVLTNHGDSVLHLAAQYGDVETMKILVSEAERLSRLLVVSGLAVEVDLKSRFQKRGGVTDELELAFETLITSINMSS